ncbi:MAG: glycosyltransferase family 39 protein [bacterium]|nr:glycosyltransferase family 39 protein [bacterium]
MFKSLLKFFQKKENLIFVLILLTAAFLRFYKIGDYMTFLGDEGRDVLVVYNILHGNLTLLGPNASVGGFFLGPIYYYFMAPFLLLFNYNPVGPAVMVAFFGVATVWLVYKIGSEFFDKRTGILAASLYTISPIVIAYSRSSWNPNLMPFFSLLTLYVLYKAVKNSSYKLFVASGILFGILLQLHYLATFVGIVIGFYILLGNLIINHKQFLLRLTQTVKNYLYFFLGFLIGWSPFLLFEARHGFPNIKSIINFIFHSGETGGNPNYFAIVWDVFFRLFGRLIMKFPPPEQISIPASNINFDFYFINFKLEAFYLFFFTLILAFGGLALFLYKLSHSFKNKELFLKLSLIFLWFFAGIFLFGFYKKSIYDYYLGFMFPLPFLFIGYFLSSLFKYQIGKIASIIFFSILVVLNLSGIPFRYVPNRQLVQVKEISDFVLSKTDVKPFNFALITGGNSDHAYRYFFKLASQDPTVIQNSQIDPERKSVTDQLLIVCEDPNCHPLGYSLWEVSGFGRAEIAGEWDVSVVKVFKLVHYSGK